MLENVLKWRTDNDTNLTIVCRQVRSVLTRDGYFRRKIKMRIAKAKEAFNIKISFLTSKLNNEMWYWRR